MILSEHESKSFSTQPGDGDVALGEAGLEHQRVVGALLEADDDVLFGDGDVGGGSTKSRKRCRDLAVS